MSNPRIRARDTSDNEMDPASRVVTPRRSIFAEESDPVEHPDPMEETEPLENPDTEEEPSEDEEEPLPNSPPAFPSSFPSSPIVPSSPILPPAPTPQQIDPRRWDWMPQVLEHWRQDEQIPMLPEVPGPDTPIPPLTQEPVHHSVPVLITRLLSHERILELLEQATRNRVDQENELAELRDMLVTTHTYVVQARDEVIVLREQVEENQHRINEMAQEMAAMRAEREQLRADAEASARMADLLGDMTMYLR